MTWRRLKRFLQLTLLGIICTLTYFISTNGGLRLTIDIANRYLPGTISTADLHGTLLRGVQASKIYYEDTNVIINAKSPRLRWNSIDLWNKKISITRAHANDLTIQLKDNPSQTAEPAKTVFTLPDFIKIDRFQIEKMHLKSAKGATLFNANKIYGTLMPHNLNHQVIIQARAPHLSFIMASLQRMQNSWQITTFAKIRDHENQMHNLSMNAILYPHSLKILDTQTKLLKKHLTLAGQLDWARALTWKFNASMGHNKFNTDGTLDKHIKAQWTASIPKISSLDKSIRGQLKIDGKVLGLADKPTLSASVIGHGLNYTDNPATIDTRMALTLNQERANVVVKGDIKHIAIYHLTDIPLHLETGHFKIDFTQKGLFSNTIIEFNKKQKASLDFNLPGWGQKSKDFSAKQVIQGQLNVALSKLDMLSELLPQMARLQGRANAKVDISGTLGSPQYEGYLRSYLQDIHVPQFGIVLKNINAKAHVQHQNKIDFTATAHAGNRKLSILGHSDLKTANMTVSGNDVLLINNDEYQVHVTPQLKVAISKSLLNVTGSIYIPRAQLKPMALGDDTVSLPDDVHIIQRSNRHPSSQLATRMNIRVTLGEHIRLKSSGIKGSIRGNLTLHKTADQPITANGHVALVNGIYAAYGQNLKIRRGDVNFLGGAIDNPALNIEAVRSMRKQQKNDNSTPLSNQFERLQDIRMMGQDDRFTVGIKILGTLQSPRIRLFSEPTVMSQSDALSYLVFGKPADKAGASNLLSAAASMKLSANDSMSIDQELKNDLGLDELSISEDNSGTSNLIGDPIENALNNRSLVVGKKLSSRLYVNYSIGLLKPISVLKLRYHLGKRWTIQTESSSTGQGIDLFYTFEK